ASGQTPTRSRRAATGRWHAGSCEGSAWQSPSDDGLASRPYFHFLLSTFPLGSCYKIASPVSSCPAHLGKHFSRQQLHALAGQVVGQRAHLTAGQHDAAAQLLLVALELLPHRRRTADDGEDALLDVVPLLLSVEEKVLVLEDGLGRSRGRVARRHDAD